MTNSRPNQVACARLNAGGGWNDLSDPPVSLPVRRVSRRPSRTNEGSPGGVRNLILLYDRAAF